jgi:hypothetical protein
MDANRFDEIVAAYGADPARWPPAERAAATAFAAGRDLADARAVDTAIAAWLAQPVQPLDDVTTTRAIDAALAAPAPRRWWPALAGGAVAAALATVAIGIPAFRDTGPAPTAAPQIAAAAPAAAPVHTDPTQGDAAMAALVFTPTPEEESLI